MTSVIKKFIIKLKVIGGEYITEFVYGGIDGVITTFAIVAGIVGADAPIYLVFVLGFASLIADGISMSISSYLAQKSEYDEYSNQLSNQMDSIERDKNKKVEQIREIYKLKGFDGDTLDSIVKTLTEDSKVFAATLLKEMNICNRGDKSPVKIGLATLISFIAMGSIPLIAYTVGLFVQSLENYLFIISAIATAIALSIIGYVRGEISNQNTWVTVSQTLLIGSTAAILAYFVGFTLHGLLLS